MNVAIIEYFNPFEPKSDFGERATLGLKSDSEISSAERETIILPLVEDISPKIETTFKTPREYFPSIFTQVEDIMKLFSTGSGSRPDGGTLTDFLDVPLWDKTQPLTMDLKFQLFTETDPYSDVVRPAMGLSSLNMLSPFPGKPDRFAVPGVSFASIQSAFKSEKNKSVAVAGDDSNFRKESKLISIEIPGVLYLNYAFIEKADPVFSNEITASGFPLWCDLTMTVKSLRPANTNMFAYAGTSYASSNVGRASDQFRRDLEASQSFSNTGFGGGT